MAGTWSLPKKADGPAPGAQHLFRLRRRAPTGYAVLRKWRNVGNRHPVRRLGIAQTTWLHACSGFQKKSR
jgi:hypothetical protein